MKPTHIYATKVLTTLLGCTAAGVAIGYGVANFEALTHSQIPEMSLSLNLVIGGVAGFLIGVVNVVKLQPPDKL